MDICEKIVLDKINLQINTSLNKIHEKYSQEINRIIKLINKNPEQINLQDLEIEGIKFDFSKEPLMEIRKANKTILELEKAFSKIKYFRVSFYLLFVFALITGGINLINSAIMPNLIITLLFVFSAILIILFFAFRIFLSNLLDKIEKDYGI